MEKDNTLGIILAIIVGVVVLATFGMLFVISNKLSEVSNSLSNISNALSKSETTETTETTEKNWDVSIVFNKAHKASFYPFSKTEGEIGKTYYAKLDKSDDLYEEYVGGECCEYSSNPYYYNDSEEKQRRRAKGWYVERKEISDSKYKLLIRGLAWADCSYEGYGYAKGELNLNPNNSWKISEVIKCYAKGSNKGQETYCETSDKFVKFAAGNRCGGCCACADSGNVDIEIIVEK